MRWRNTAFWLLTIAPHESKAIQTTGFPWVNNVSANARMKQLRKQGDRKEEAAPMRAMVVRYIAVVMLDIKTTRYP